jgi:hypothetical protein
MEGDSSLQRGRVTLTAGMQVLWSETRETRLWVLDGATVFHLSLVSMSLEGPGRR